MTSYIMDSPNEGERVERKTDTGLTLDQLRWAGLQSGKNVLDLGCAAGTTCRIMADLVGTDGQIIGVDASPERIADARARTSHGNVVYQEGSAYNLPLLDNHVDIAWSRFLFEYLPDPEGALREMIRVTKPGGTVVASDLDGNCIWHSNIRPELDREIRAALETFGDRFNPIVGRQLPTMFMASGLADIEVDIRPYHIVCGRITEPSLSYWRAKLAGVGESLMRLGWSRDQAESLVREFENHLLDPHSFTYSILISVKGRKIAT